jgi:REP element-mobilizing transposase RayT
VFDDPVFRSVAETMWQRIPRHFPHVELDEWVVMPNHVHGIIVIVDDLRGRGDASVGSCSIEDGTAHGKSSPVVNRPSADASPLPEPPRGPPPGSLGAIVGNFKSVTTRRINRIRKTPGARVWQRNYHDRVIRGERGLVAVRRYIQENPLRWAEDRETPTR